MNDLQKNKRIPDGIFLIFFVCVTALFVGKAPYGFHFFDEANWLTLSRRLLQGDALFAEDWSITQTGLSLLYPLMLLYDRIFDGTEGMVLTFRYAFVVFHAVNTLLLYLLLRRKSAWKALCAVTVFMPFTRWSAENFSYYQLSLEYVLLCGALLATMKKPYAALPTAGFLFSLAVLTCPFLAVYYVLYTLVCVVFAILRKEKPAAFRGRVWLLFSGGCAAAAVLFLSFVFSRCSLRELLINLPYIFGDKSHDVGSAGSKLLRFFQGTVQYSNKADIPAIAAAAVLLADRKRRKRRSLYTALLMLSCLFGLFGRYKSAFMSGMLTRDVCLMRPLCIAGFASYILCDKKDKEFFVWIYLGACAHFVCLYLASDLGYDIYNTAMTGAAAASACFMAQLLSELQQENGGRKAPGYAAAALCLTMLASQLWVELEYRKNFCFCEPCGTALMSSVIRQGVGKGEKTAPEVAFYEQEGLWNATEKVRNAPGDYVLYFSADAWPYLEDSKRCASCSIWLQPRYAVEEAERLLCYWELHPERKPDAIFVSKTMEDAEEAMELINTENFPVEENDRGYVLLRVKNGSEG